MKPHVFLSNIDINIYIYTYDILIYLSVCLSVYLPIYLILSCPVLSYPIHHSHSHKLTHPHFATPFRGPKVCESPIEIPLKGTHPISAAGASPRADLAGDRQAAPQDAARQRELPQGVL